MSLASISLPQISIDRNKLGLFIASATGIGFLIYLFYGEAGRIPSLSREFPLYLSGLLIANAAGYVVYRSDRALTGWIPWKKNTGLRFLLGMVVNYVLAWAVVVSLSAVIIYVIRGLEFQAIYELHLDNMIKLSILLFVIIIVYTIVSFTLYSYHDYAVGQIDTVRHERKQLKLQFDALRSQLSPHYLFNCLNTVSSLVHRDTEQAELFVRRLAGTYQYILATNDRKLVTLGEEIDFVKSYYYLLKVRYEDGITVEFNVPDHVLNLEVPPLTLQILLENAVKHNVFSKENPIHIYVGVIDNTFLKVINNKTEQPQLVRSFRVGLNNIRRRFEYFTDKKIKVIDGEDFRVEVPLLKPEVETEEAGL